MKQFTISDTQPHAGHLGLFADRSELVYDPLIWQELGFQETSTGYGGKLTSCHKIHFEGKLRRLYVSCYGNAVSTWFKTAKHGLIYVN